MPTPSTPSPVIPFHRLSAVASAPADRTDTTATDEASTASVADAADTVDRLPMSSKALTLQGVLLLLQALPHYAFLKDGDSHYLGCNQAFSQLVGLPNPEAIVGKSDYELGWQVPGDKADFFRQGDQATLAGEPITDQQETLTLSGSLSRVVSMNKRRLVDTEGRVIGILGVAHDITEQRQMETALHSAQTAAKLAQQAKTTFLTNIAHDLRTPFSGMLGMIDLLRNQAAHTSQQASLDLLKDASEQLLLRVNQMITYAAQQCTQPPTRQPLCSPNSLLKQVDALLQPLAQQKKLTLRCHSDVGCAQSIISDEHRLYTIVLSLVSNALAFTEQGSVTVSMELSTQNVHSGFTHTLILRVKDTGIGINPHHQAAIYEPFTRLQPAYQHDTPGMGLGLSLVKQHLKALGGDITLQSTLHQGSTFTCHIPLTAANDTLTDTSHHHHHLLVVEDQPIAHMALQVLLDSLGCSVDVVTSGQAALDAVSKTHYDLILMDLGLPDMSGIEVTRRIRQLPYPPTVTSIQTRVIQAASVPIVALSAHLDASLKAQCHTAGMQDALIKPLRLAQAKALLAQTTLRNDGDRSVRQARVAVGGDGMGS